MLGCIIPKSSDCIAVVEHLNFESTDCRIAVIEGIIPALMVNFFLRIPVGAFRSFIHFDEFLVGNLYLACEVQSSSDMTTYFGNSN